MNRSAHETVEGALTWQVFPWILVRFASIPRSTLARTRFTATLSHAKRARLLRREVTVSAELLSSRLYEVIPKLGAGARRDCLAARRTIFQLKVPAAGDWIDRVLEVDAGMHVDLNAWLASREMLAAAEAERDAAYDRETQEYDDVVWTLFELPCFHRGLSMANPLLAAYLTAMCQKPTQGYSARDRAQRARGVRYLHRAAFKPTPFGFFAGVAIAQLGCDLSTAALDVSRLASFRSRTDPVPVTSDDADHGAQRQTANIYLDPGVFRDADGVWAISRQTGEPIVVSVDGAADVFTRIMDSSRPRVPRHEMNLHLPDEALDGLVLAGVIGLETADSEEEVDRTAGSANRPQMGTRYEDAIHPTVLTLRHDMFSGFVDEVLEYGATTLYAGLLPEQRGLVRVFAELYGERKDVSVLAFFRDFVAVRRARGLDHLAIHAAASVLGHESDAGLTEAAAPLAQAIRRDLCADLAATETTLALDLSHFAKWERATSTRLSMLLAPGPDGLSSSRFWIRLWGAERMSLFPRYASALSSIAPTLITDYRRFMQLWPETADLWGRDVNVDARPRVTHATLSVPGCCPCADSISLRDLRVHLDSAAGRLVLTEFGKSPRDVKPVFFGVSNMERRPPLYQFLDILGDHRTSVFELILRTLGCALAEETAWRQRGSVKHLPAVALGEHVLLSPEMARIEAAAIPDLASSPPRQAFLNFHDWWEDHDLPLVAEVHVPRGAMWVDVGNPDGMRSFYGHIRGAERVHLLFPFTTDGDSLRSVEGDSHEVEFALEVAAGAKRERSHELRHPRRSD